MATNYVSKSNNDIDKCTIIKDIVVRQLCSWCAKRGITTDSHDPISFWMNFDVEAIDRTIPIKVRRDGKNIKYRFDYNQIYPPLEPNDGNLEDYIDALEFLLNDETQDAVWRFTLQDIDGKKIVRGRCWRKADENTLRENENQLLVVMRHAIKIISLADKYFNNQSNTSSNKHQGKELN